MRQWLPMLDKAIQDEATRPPMLDKSIQKMKEATRSQMLDKAIEDEVARPSRMRMPTLYEDSQDKVARPTKPTEAFHYKAPMLNQTTAPLLKVTFKSNNIKPIFG